MSSSLRVSSGIAKGRNLEVPKVPGIRIAQEIVRQAIFSILGEKIVGADCLDLYAGSGSIGIEALSRGASRAEFIDINEESVVAIRRNLEKCGLSQLAEVTRDDALKFVSNCYKTYDIIFMDPYYDQAIHKHIFKSLPNLLKQDSVLIFLHGDGLNCMELVEDSGLVRVDERKYGATVLDILTKAP